MVSLRSSCASGQGAAAPMQRGGSTPSGSSRVCADACCAPARRRADTDRQTAHRAGIWPAPRHSRLQAFLDRFRRRIGARRQIAQQAQLALADHALGDFGDDAQHAGDAAVVVVDRAVGKGVVGLLGKAAALEEQQQALIPGGLAALEHLLDARADVRPDLLPHLVRTGAQHPVALDADGRQVGVVAEEGEVRRPTASTWRSANRA